MKNSRSFQLKKAASLWMASAMIVISLLSVPFTGVALNVSKEEDGYYVPTTADFELDKSWWTENIPSMKAAAKGITLTYNGGDVGRTVPTRNKYNIDGLSLRFANLTKNEGCSDDLRFSVVFSPVHTGIGNFRLMFDTAAGTLNYFNGTVAPVAVITDDSLKYESLSQNEFSITFRPQPDKSILADVRVGGKLLTGVIPYEGFIHTLQNNGDFVLNSNAMYVKLAPGKAYTGSSYYYSVDVTGIDYDPYTRPTGAVLPTRTDGVAASAKSNPIGGMYPDHVLCTFRDLDVGGRLWSGSSYPVNGLALRFKDITTLDTSKALKFAVTLTTAGSNSIGNVRIMIDTSTGAVGYWNGTTQFVQLTRNDCFLYDNLTGREFEMLFEINSNKELVCDIIVDNQTVSCVLPANYFASLGTENAFFTVAPGNSKCSFSVKLTGVRSAKVVKFTDGGNTVAKVFSDNNIFINPPLYAPEGERAMLGWKNLNDGSVGGNEAKQITASVTYEAVTAAYGDVNRDGEINASDISALRVYLLSGEGVQYTQLLDMNHDDSVNIIDLICMKKAAVRAD